MTMFAEDARDSPVVRAAAGKSGPLKRGRACMSCRFLKIKCDAAKPVCGPCRRHQKDDECEYADGPGRSRTKVLEDTVSRLEARLHELEHPEASTPSVTLHDPYLHDGPSGLSTSTLVIPDVSVSPFSPTTSSSSLPSGRHWQPFTALEPITQPLASSASSKSPVRHSSFLGAEEPSLPLIQTLLDKFIPHCTQFGFFLHVNNFQSATLRSAPFGHHSRPSRALLSVVYLWGVHLSRSEALLLKEQNFLTRALQHTATDLFSDHPHRILHTLQAQILLAYFFFRTGRFLAAKSYTSAAVALALGCQLHKIRSATLAAPSTTSIVAGTPEILPLPATFLDEGERINGFWAVLMLHKMMTVALELPSDVCGALEAPGMQIDTPWGLDIEHYAEGVLSPDLRGMSTVRNFLGGYEDPHGGGSINTLAVKASILFHRATHLTGQWIPNMQQREFQAFAAAYQSIHHLIAAFNNELPPLTHLAPANAHYRTLLLANALTQAATIKLHGIFAYTDPSSKHLCIAAARMLLDAGGATLHEIGYVNPVMGTLWMTACQVFIDEISRVRLTQATWPGALTGDLVEEDLMERLRSGLTALSLFSEDSSLIHYQLTKVQEAFSAI